MDSSPGDAVTPAQRERINSLQRDVLEAIALRRPLAESMDLLCRRAEAIAPDLICTVLLVSDDGRVHTCAAPSMPVVFSAAIEGARIGPRAGSCGTAAFLREDVEVTSIASDPLWDDYRRLALPLGLAACWSSPVLSDGRVVATFAIYYHEPRKAGTYHREMVEACVHLCAIAIQNHEATEHNH